MILSRPIERLDLQAEVARRREDELTRLRRELEESQLRHESQVTGHIYCKKTSDSTFELPITALVFAKTGSISSGTEKPAAKRN